MNLKVRVRNINFWLTAIPTVILLIEEVAELFGYALQLEGVSAQLVSIVNTVFVALALVGVVNDPTTSGLTDSAMAMTYETPNNIK